MAVASIKKEGYLEELDNLKSELKIRGFSPLTVRNYVFFVDKFLDGSKKNSKDLGESDVKSYLANMFDTKSKNTIMLAAASLKFFFKEVLKKDMGEIVLPKKDKKLPEVLSRDEVKKLIDSTSFFTSSLDKTSGSFLSFFGNTISPISFLSTSLKKNFNDAAASIIVFFDFVSNIFARYDLTSFS